MFIIGSFLKDSKNNTETKRHSLNYNMADKTKAPNKEILRITKKASVLMPAFNYRTTKHLFLRKNLLFFKIMQSLSRCHRRGLCKLYLRQTLVIIHTSQTPCVLDSRLSVHYITSNCLLDLIVRIMTFITGGQTLHYTVCQSLQAIQYLKKNRQNYFPTGSSYKQNK